MSLKFAHIEYSITTRSLDIFTIGCGKGITDLNDPDYDGCKNCCNPEIRNWSLEGFTIPTVVSKVVQLDTKYGNLIDKILIVGGDPLDGYFKYKEEFLEFLKELKTINKPIYLFTRHSLEQIPEELLELLDYVKTGAYIPELTCEDNYFDDIKLATSNQKIYKVSEVLNGSNKICQ